MNIKQNQRHRVITLVAVVLVAIILACAAVNTISISQESDYYHEFST